MRNRTRHQIIISVCMLCISFLLCVGAAAAWFGTRFRTGSILLTSGEVKAEFKLFKYNDFNDDGLPDWDFVKNDYSYTVVDDITVTNFMPGDTHTYRLEVTNETVNRAIYNTVDVHYDTDAENFILGEVIQIGRRYTSEGEQHEVNKVISVGTKEPDGNYVRLGGSDDVISAMGTSVLDIYITFLTGVADTVYNDLQNVTFSIPKIDIALVQK